MTVEIGNKNRIVTKKVSGVACTQPPTRNRGAQLTAWAEVAAGSSTVRSRWSRWGCGRGQSRGLVETDALQGQFDAGVVEMHITPGWVSGHDEPTVEEVPLAVAGDGVGTVHEDDRVADGYRPATWRRHWPKGVSRGYESCSWAAAGRFRCSDAWMLLEGHLPAERQLHLVTGPAVGETPVQVHDDVGAVDGNGACVNEWCDPVRAR